MGSPAETKNKASNPEVARSTEEPEPLPEISLHGSVLAATNLSADPAAGDHLLEVELTRAAAPDVFVRALKTMGFEEVLVDQSTLKSTSAPASTGEAQTDPHVEAMWQRWREWGSPFAANAPEDGPLRFRFVGRLAYPIRILDTPFVRWIYAQQSTMDLLSDPSNDPFEPVVLETGRTYEIRFLARTRVQPTRANICEALAGMGGGGFRPLKITSLRRNIRLPGLPGTNFVLWYGVAIWEGPLSRVSSEDPFFFEKVRQIG